MGCRNCAFHTLLHMPMDSFSGSNANLCMKKMKCGKKKENTHSINFLHGIYTLAHSHCIERETCDADHKSMGLYLTVAVDHR